jgi:hypothetical protein
MKFLSEANLPALGMAVVTVSLGISIIYDGRIWDISLGEERYLVGGVAVLFGIYFGLLGIRHK